MARRKQPKGPDRRFLAAPAIDHDPTLGDLAPLPPAAPGWDNWYGWHDSSTLRKMRARQVERCVDHLATWDASAPIDAEPPEVLIREATVILRAGPAATPLELTRGRIA